ncbi:MAG: hypothetical protein IT363_00725 [Methanoregulaceae archaeon]|nr:hypothetical protein [Methanoregulaceae archaeon]
MRPKRMCVFLLLLLGASVARAEDTVTLHMMARPLGDVISEVARQTKLPLGAARSAAGLPVFISVKEMPVSVLLKRLLDATGTEWLEEGKQVVLSKAGPLKAARAAEARAFAQRLDQRIGDYLKSAKLSLDWSEDALEQRARKIIARRDAHHKREVTEFSFHIESETPYHLVIKEFLERVPSTTFTAIPANSSLVFSTRPNALQVALPYRPEAPGTAARLEQDLHRRLVKAGVRFMGKNGRDEAAPPARPPADRLIVRVERYEQTSFTFTAYVVGSAGEIVATSSFATTVSPQPSSITIGSFPAGTVRLSANSAEFGRSLIAYQSRLPMRYRPEFQRNVLGGGVFDGCTSESLKQVLRVPTKVDPLSYIVADVLDGLAEQTKSQLIAMVPDSLLSRLSQSSGKGEIPLTALWQSYTTVSFTKDEHGWLIRPRSFVSAADGFADRTALERLLHSPTLREIARYASTMAPHWVSGAVDFLWLDLLEHQVQRSLSSIRDYLRVLDALPSRAWGAGPGVTVRLALSSVPRTVKSNLDRILQRSASSIGYELVEGRTPNEISRRETTELLGYGLDDRVFIEVSRSRSSLLSLVRDGQPDRVLTPFEYGQLGQGAPPELLIVDSDEIVMTFTMGRAPHGTASMSVHKLREPRTIYTAPRLPEAFKAQIEAGRKAAGPSQ